MNLIIIILWIFYLYFRTKKALLMLQQNLYDNDFRYLKWIKNNLFKIMINVDIIPILFIIMLLFIKNNFLLNIFLCFIYLILCINEYAKSKNEIIKKPLVITSRIKRLLFTLCILYLVVFYFSIVIYNLNYICIMISMSYLQYILLWICVKINIPVEKCVYLKYKHQALRKLNSFNNLDVIGITGSYGKTSSKNILNEILSVKYNSIPTPKNLNTPYGLIITINNYIDKFDELFIAEMGAYKMGEIKELCDLVHPKYGILTRIGTAHLELFGSQENIQKGKFELIESLPSDGLAILNADDSLQVNYKLRNKVKVVWIGIDNDADFKATNIKVTKDGTSFDLIIKNDKNKYKFETKLLGYANIYNILSSLALGYNLGISINDLQRAVKIVKPVEHRLELKQRNDITYIDDAYNSNSVGSKMALDVLKLMDGKKIIITPGMVELGSIENESNQKFGEYIAEVCDEVILIGKKQTQYIYKGLLNKNYDIKHIYILDNVNDAFKLLNSLKDKKTYVLLENDLPDTF